VWGKGVQGFIVGTRDGHSSKVRLSLVGWIPDLPTANFPPKPPADSQAKPAANNIDSLKTGHPSGRLRSFHDQEPAATMRFGQDFHRRIIPQWEYEYVDYNKLKRLVKSAANENFHQDGGLSSKIMTRRCDSSA